MSAFFATKITGGGGKIFVNEIPATRSNFKHFVVVLVFSHYTQFFSLYLYAEVP
jgi:hypothetical protein